MNVPPPWVRRSSNGTVWFARPATPIPNGLAVSEMEPQIFPTEEAVGVAMLRALHETVATKEGPVHVGLLGGRGAQALHRLLGRIAESGDPDELLPRLHVWMQDALAPLPADNPFSFFRDFERLLGPAFFERVAGVHRFDTQADDLEAEVFRYARELVAAGGLDLLFLGHGPEADQASHVAYIRPHSGADRDDWAGVVPLSGGLLGHHISKFKAGGTVASPEEEALCRNASHILTIGPAAILNARRLVQSVVDASTAPAKRATYVRVLETPLAGDERLRARQLDENPGLWVRLHPRVCSFVLPDLLE